MVGWQKSAVDRHRQAAVRLAPDGVLRPAREMAAAATEALASNAHRIGERISALFEPDNAAAAGGLGRTAGFCGAAGVALVCGVAATAPLGPGADAAPSDGMRAITDPAAKSERTPRRAPFAETAIALSLPL